MNFKFEFQREEIIMQVPNPGYVLPDDCGRVKLEYQMYCTMNLDQNIIYIVKGNSRWQPD